MKGWTKSLFPSVTLYLTSDQLQHICHHAECTYPDECCGLLLGHAMPGQTNDGAIDRTVVELRPLINAWDAAIAQEMANFSEIPAQHELTKSRRYWIDPKDMLEAQRYARDRNLTIVGIYHSHPDNPAVPSECDRVLAWSSYSYLIVSVPQGRAQDLLSWTLDDTHQFKSEPIHSTNSPSVVQANSTF
jgi:proteasome lid subunit RPN8/RPN11